MTAAQSGPLTRSQLLALWQGSVDSTYGDPIVAAGDGHGLEVFTQFFVALERVSLAADITTQAAYLRPFSGQTAPEAQGEANATVTIAVTRNAHIEKPLVMAAGRFIFEEIETDWSDSGSTAVQTGRYYVVVTTTVIPPGSLGPVDVPCVAAGPGWGYNNPLPGAIKGIVQEGGGLENIEASVSLTVPPLLLAPANPLSALVACIDEPDVFVPSHVGQYVEFTAGANIGQVGRVIAYGPPDLSVYPPIGGTVRLADSVSFDVTPVSGSLVAGEVVKMRTAGVDSGYATVLDVSTVDGFVRVTGDMISGAVGDQAIGQTSGAVATIVNVVFRTSYAAEAFAASWRVLEWDLDFGLVATNLHSPTGGRLGFLDEIGAERGLPRASGEGDDHYRERIGTILDNVTPNAIRRAINRALVPVGATGCLREAGREGLPGLFYDAGSSLDPVQDPAHNFAYDMDFDLRPADRFKLYLSFAEFRGFFLVTLPSLTIGEFGFPFDTAIGDPHPFINPYDVGGAYDGFPAGASPVYQSLWAAISEKKAAGVDFDFVRDAGPCP